MSEFDRSSEIDTAGNVLKNSLPQDSVSNQQAENHQHNFPDLKKNTLQHEEEAKISIIENDKVELASSKANSVPEKDKSEQQSNRLNNNNAGNQRRESKSVHSATGRSNNSKRLSTFIDPSLVAEKHQLNIWKNVKKFIKGKYFDYIIIILVLFYTSIIFAYFALDTKEYDGNNSISLALYVIQFVELAILIFFCLEIILRVCASSFEIYFKDRFNVLDASCILVSLVLTIMDIIITENTFSQISRIFRSIFRFARLFLVFKKVNEIHQIQTLHIQGQIKTPVERIMDIMQNLMENIEEEDLAKQLKWCMEMVSSNKLYEPILGDGEAAVWGNIYASQKKKGTPLLKAIPSPGAASTIDSNTPLIFNFKPILVPMEHIEHFKHLDEISFDVFKYHDTVKENNLSYLLIHLFNKQDIFFKAHIEPQHLFSWANHVSDGYFDNLYHNKIHAFDVTQMMHYFLQTMNFITIGELSGLEIGIMYMAAAAHDFEHPGFNNPYLVSTRHEFAIRYNDKSPLENHHASSVFNLMLRDNSNVFIHLSKEDSKKSRERIIQMILHTDNSFHFADLAKLKGRLSSADFDPKDKDKDISMASLMHSADVSNPYKPWNICKVWTKKVLDEFWSQGDRERESGLAITYLCDRFTTNTSKSQAGFIDFIVKPLYETVNKILPLLDLTPFTTNKAKWAELTDFYEEELAKLKKEIEDGEIIEIKND